MTVLAWPTGEESFFRVDPGSHDVACLNYLDDMSYGYATGYRLLAEWGLERATSERRHQDLVVYPILFNIRHHIELMLKLIIRDCRYIESGGEGDVNLYTHDILELWRRARGLIEKLFPNDAEGEKEALRAVEECLVELSRYDPHSTGFRYERQRDGTRSLEGVSHIDLRQVREIVERVGNFLDCSRTVVSQAREWADERLAEMAEFEMTEF